VDRQLYPCSCDAPGTLRDRPLSGTVRKCRRCFCAADGSDRATSSIPGATSSVRCSACSRAQRKSWSTLSTARAELSLSLTGTIWLKKKGPQQNLWVSLRLKLGVSPSFAGFSSTMALWRSGIQNRQTFRMLLSAGASASTDGGKDVERRRWSCRLMSLGSA